MSTKIQFRRDTAANWTANNPTLSEGEMGLETDTGKFKVGNGTEVWTALVHSSGAQGIQGIQGEQGIQGVQGIQGDTGIQGIQGIKGDTGDQGIQGIQGDVGPQGIQGIPGMDGVDGETSLNAAQTFTGGQRGAVVELTSVDSLVAIDLSSSNNFSHTTTQNTVLAAPSNPVAGQSGVIVITQGATICTLAYNTFWKFAGGVIPTLTATVGAVDVLAYFVESPTRATAQLIRNTK